MSVKKTIIATSDALRDSNTFIYHRKTIDAIINKDPVSAYNSMMVHVCGLREFIAGKISEKNKNTVVSKKFKTTVFLINTHLLYFLKLLYS